MFSFISFEMKILYILFHPVGIDSTTFQVCSWFIIILYSIKICLRCVLTSEIFPIIRLLHNLNSVDLTLWITICDTEDWITASLFPTANGYVFHAYLVCMYVCMYVCNILNYLKSPEPLNGFTNHYIRISNPNVLR